MKIMMYTTPILIRLGTAGLDSKVPKAKLRKVPVTHVKNGFGNSLSILMDGSISRRFKVINGVARHTTLDT